ncbi:glucose-6-phosphate dehydrogenase assembly protein OpcA [Ruania zhangjianzhongii]|uniref:glucose-6-phosphate dehydrogenase assembly protein OpcA n=1 Tax=Ruania zhangjianzhongii TaxID=2603206 RepID=UPI0011C891AC|nr:glucose-6-phosphate dehydrogenase assembly protein OpcA [Ruania zhangjianzhongii]
MIITLEDTSTAEIGARLVDLREEGGVVALGRVLTLVIIATGDEAETAVEAANRASREHPCRVIVVDQANGRADVALDAEIRIGADAGASDVVVLRPFGGARAEVDTLVMPLLLPDAPIVVWWPSRPPAVLGAEPLGAMAHRRISDVGECEGAIELLADLGAGYTAGDTDLSWARTTLWRGITAAALDQTTARVDRVTVYGSSVRPSTHLFAAWLATYLEVPTVLQGDPDATAITGVELQLGSDTISMHRPEGSSVVTLNQPGHPEHQIAMPKRPLEDCLMEDLRRLDPDEVYRRTLVDGLPKVQVATAEVAR